MTDREARDIIEADLREKLLGPGYAKDIIVCADDCHDEIIPESPRNAYRVGIIVPSNNNGTPEQNDNEEQNQPEDEVAIVADTDNDTDSDTFKDKNLSERAGEPDDSDNTSNSQTNPMSTHIGLITCVPSADETVNINFSYGTYAPLPWHDQINVKVKTGKFTDSIPNAIAAFDNDNRTINTSNRPLSEIIVINREENTISLSPELAALAERPRIMLPNTEEYTVEAELIKTLFSNCHQRTHHAHTLEGVNCRQPNRTVTFNDDNNVSVYIDSYEASGKRFLSVILKSTSNHYLYQPKIEVTGNLVSYTEPVSTIEDDEENAINEFLYRDVRNYGKGINCAVNWDEDARRIFTTFTPIVDVEKFSNQLSTDNQQEGPVAQACTLRNLSLWSEINIIDALNAFVNGYNTWHQNQTTEAEGITGFDTEKQTILNNQETLLNRLRNNVTYLQENPEALECFKIANTAMLMQMVVARHPLFEKNRDAANYNDEPADVYDDLGFFSDGRYTENGFNEPSYYPFQLAFLLMNVKSTFDVNDPSRKLVDLIWFPTGGGKTEAYLALSALTIVARRRRNQNRGVSVIMRYTLRLLTTQQFERATYLICALDFLRTKDNTLNLGPERISIGLYVGSGVTPNKKADLKKGYYKEFLSKKTDNTARRNNNPFPITYCPWCGSRLVNKHDGHHGYMNDGTIFCTNNRCHFRGNNGRLPLCYIDENIYNSAPTLLFATVDKFAQLYSGTHANLLRPNNNVDTPDLIIQDELHLLVGALGSIVGLYESIIEKLCTTEGRFPKIIAATATTRNTSELINKLYHRQAAVFPPQGLSYNDNYFSHVVEDDSKRRHLGLISAECVSSNMTEIRLTSLLILSKVKIFKKHIEDMNLDWLNPDDVRNACSNNGVLARVLDNYWATVLYFNSLKDLGRSRSRVSQEIFEGVRAHQYLYSIPNSLAFLRPKNGFDQRVLEFTSRIDSSRIKSMLTRAETPVHLTANDNGGLTVEPNAVDLVFASNMISVGIDIARWNLMVMVGQPRSNSEYIQSSSRAARTTYGLVVNLMNPRRIREHSLFENYVPFHRTFYKGVEPLSITPLTPATIKHDVLANIVRIYRQYFVQAGIIEPEVITDTIIENLFWDRYGLQQGDPIVTDLLNVIQNKVTYILNNPQGLEYAQSLREIAPDSYISISNIN